MGLDIRSKSDKGYHYSYSGIHYIRWMGHRAIGGKLSYSAWHEEQRSQDEAPEYEKALKRFPNLYWHSDCDGTYTLKGKIRPFTNPGTLQTGNSKGLLNELQFIKDTLPGMYDPQVTDRDWYVFNMFYDLVKDVVENHDGRIEFC